MEITIKFNENDVINHNEDITKMFSVVTAIAMSNQQNMVQEMQKSGGTKEQKVVQSQEQQTEPELYYSIEQIREIANKKAKAIENGKTKVIRILKKYGTTSVSCLKQEQFEAFLKDLEVLQ